MRAELSNADSLNLSDSFIHRLQSSYQFWNETSTGYGNSDLWAMITEKNRDIHNALLSNDLSVKPMLENITKTNLYYGVDNIAATIIESLPETSEPEAIHLVNCLARLSEAFMTKLVPNPEQPGTKGEITSDYSLEGFEASLSSIKKEHFPNLKFINPFPNEFGVKSSLGLVSYRALQALYQALLVKRIFNGYGLEGEIVEIGGGVGRTAHWLTLLDLRVTIVDLPLGLIAQAIYLSQCIGELSLQLPFEKKSNFHKVSLINPSQFTKSIKNNQFSLALNVDSFTEMNPSMVDSYLDVIQQNNMHLLSINHEVNDFTVGNLIRARSNSKVLYRSPYWMRPGYTEDLFKFTN